MQKYHYSFSFDSLLKQFWHTVHVFLKFALCTIQDSIFTLCVYSDAHPIVFNEVCSQVSVWRISSLGTFIFQANVGKSPPISLHTDSSKVKRRNLKEIRDAELKKYCGRHTKWHFYFVHGSCPEVNRWERNPKKENT